MTTPDLHINHIRLHYSGGHHPGSGHQDGGETALKLSLQQALRQVRLPPGRLPPGVVLIIRRLQSRQPFDPRASQMGQWQRHVESRIEELARTARQPARQYVPPDAASVLFYDEVELLVCFTRDVLARRSTWYWAGHFPEAAYPGRPTGEQLMTGWQAYPQALPQALVELKPHEIGSALKSLNPNQLSGPVHLLHRTFDLPDDVFEAAVSDPNGEREGQQEPVESAPWQALLPPQLSQTLAPRAAYLLGLCHTLVRSPQQARQPRFARTAKRWLEQETARPQTAVKPYLPPHSISQEEPPDIVSNYQNPRPTRGWPPTTGRPLQDKQIAESNALTLEEPPTSLPEGTRTNLGGAVFLINLLTQLRLAAVIPALAELNPWELLGAITAGLLGGRFPDYRDDALWAIFSELANLEPDQRWGEALPEPVDFELPQEWAGHSRGEPLWSPKEGGYETGPLPDLIAPYLGWYVGKIRPYLTHLLSQMTGQPIETILCQPAVLYRTRTHLDLRLSLEQVSIPLRKAGLDRTPGWLPEYGYIVMIYFE